MAALDDLTNAGLPIPSIYGSEMGSADQAYQQALAGIAQQQASAYQNYGFTAQADPNNGQLSNIAIDPNQQYSQVMNLLNSHAGNMRSLRENLSGSGLTSGGMKGLAAQRAQLLRFQQQGQVAGLGSRFASTVGGLENQKAGALATRSQGYDNAARDAINFAIQNGWFNQPTPQSGAPAPQGGAPAPANGSSGDTYQAPIDQGAANGADLGMLGAGGLTGGSGGLWGQGQGAIDNSGSGAGIWGAGQGAILGGTPPPVYHPPTPQNNGGQVRRNSF